MFEKSYLEGRKGDKIMKKVIIILLVTLIAIFLTGCNNNSMDNYSPSLTSVSNVSNKKGYSEAIQEAKEKQLTQYSIATQAGIKISPRIDWGTCTAVRNEEDTGWNVTLKGNVSGYRDDYKTDYISSKAFTYEVFITD